MITAPKRLKTLTRDGAAFVIAPLTMKQVEDFGRQPENKGEERTVFRGRAYDLVCQGLNNAMPDDTKDEDRWTHDAIRQHLDYLIFNWLQDEIIKFSGIEITNAEATEDAPAPGETAATGNN